MFEGVKESAISKPESEGDVCDQCFGTGTKIDPEKGAIRCPCKTRGSSQKLLHSARIPSRYANCSLDNFRVSHDSSQEKAFLYAGRLVLDFPAVDKGLLFMGPAGVGKTHLAVAIIKGLLAKGFPCVFYEFGSLLKEIQDSYNPVSKSSELGVLSPIYEAEVLVLDELGAAIPTDWVRDTMYQIINKRYNDRKLTIFTTNYLDIPKNPASTEIPRVGAKNNSERIREMTTLEDRIGSRLRSRLYEMCTKVVMEGEDYRTHMGRRRFDVSKS